MRALEIGIACFNVESSSELERLNRLAGGAGKRVPVSLRVNPDVDPKTHPYISTGLKENKFGIAFEDALPLYRRAAALPHIDVRGIDMHIGSQITDIGPIGKRPRRRSRLSTSWLRKVLCSSTSTSAVALESPIARTKPRSILPTTRR